jgi:hypothetical protein
LADLKFDDEGKLREREAVSSSETCVMCDGKWKLAKNLKTVSLLLFVRFHVVG